ncbi:hypothetical protein EVAR_18586_1 [Eumeta japonica]|uniref:Uncharacterized protein n=1 Tax=Eumeta variegata TaxID=151549 RepID=A0A4C1V420_EUMVA|nr:hypothetical protein EVAR_18586_1 [Eumeta japonica]
MQWSLPLSGRQIPKRGEPQKNDIFRSPNREDDVATGRPHRFYSRQLLEKKACQVATTNWTLRCGTASTRSGQDTVTVTGHCRTQMQRLILIFLFVARVRCQSDILGGVVQSGQGANASAVGSARVVIPSSCTSTYDALDHNVDSCPVPDSDRDPAFDSEPGLGPNRFRFSFRF